MPILSGNEHMEVCPFCNNKDYLLGSTAHSPLGTYAVVCSLCNAQGPYADSKREAIAVWNSRPSVKQEPITVANNLKGEANAN